MKSVPNQLTLWDAYVTILFINTTVLYETSLISMNSKLLIHKYCCYLM